MIDIDSLTIGQVRELNAMFPNKKHDDGLNEMIGKTVIVRTFSAGVHCGTLSRKAGNEVILTNARRMWRWWAAKSISLSGVALHGIDREKSRIAPMISEIWLEAIEIIPLSDLVAASIMEAPDAEAR